MNIGMETVPIFRDRVVLFFFVFFLLADFGAIIADVVRAISMLCSARDGDGGPGTYYYCLVQ